LSRIEEDILSRSDDTKSTEKTKIVRNRKEELR